MSRAVAVAIDREALRSWAREELASWRWLGRPKQLAPLSHIRTLISGGRGSGKTRAGAETLAEWAWSQPETEWCVVAPTYGHARAVCIEGRKSGLLRALGGQGGRKVQRWNRSTGEISLTNGSLIVVDGADDGAPGIQGHNLAGGWVDEIGLWSLRRWQQAWHESIIFATREGRGQMVATGTPKQGHPLIRLLRADPGWHKVTMATGENVANLSADVIAELEQRYGGTRLGRQELLGEFLEDVPGALWTLAMIDANRAPLPVREHRGVVVPDLTRIVVAVDPAATSGEESDETGIVAVGLGADGDCYVLDDRSCRMSPDGWGRRVVQGYHDMQAEAVVAETNQGGEMVLHVLRTVAPRLPVKLVHASRGKRLRAEPVSALYEQGRVHHVVPLPELEDQMVRWTPEGGVHDDRLDALVYAVTELALGDHGVPRVRVIADESEREGWARWA